MSWGVGVQTSLLRVCQLVFMGICSPAHIASHHFFPHRVLMCLMCHQKGYAFNQAETTQLNIKITISPNVIFIQQELRLFDKGTTCLVNVYTLFFLVRIEYEKYWSHKNRDAFFLTRSHKRDVCLRDEFQIWHKHFPGGEDELIQLRVKGQGTISQSPQVLLCHLAQVFYLSLSG